MVNHVAFIWNIAESLRGPFKPSEYGAVVLPFTVLRRLDAVLADTKSAVLQTAKAIESLPEMLQTVTLTEASGHEFYNTSPFDLGKLVADPQDLRANLASYLAGFSPNVRDIFERFEFDKTLNKLERDRSCSPGRPRRGGHAPSSGHPALRERAHRRLRCRRRHRRPSDPGHARSRMVPNHLALCRRHSGDREHLRRAGIVARSRKISSARDYESRR